MKHHLVPAIIMALSLVPSIARSYDFSAVNDDGLTICYDIISEEDKTCKVTRYYPGPWEVIERTYPLDLSGDLRIPQYANEYKVVSIAEYAFYNCSGLTSVTIPSSVTSIEDLAFLFCSGLTSVEIPSNVTSIGSGAFQGCISLISITIPSSVTSIGYYMFSRCDCLTSIVVESGNPVYDSRNNCNAIIETASNTLISGCKNTQIPSSVTSIEAWAFAYCRGLTSITIPSCVTSIGSQAFEYCSGLTSITIPNGVTSIGVWAFGHCSGLTSVYIPSSVTSIGYAAFSGCSLLKSVTIPSNVTAIDFFAFSDCTNLSTVYSRITDFFNIDKSVFQGSENTTLYVPKGMANTYRASTGWSVFKNIKEIPSISMQLSCNTKGSVSINDTQSISSKITSVSILENTDNTFTFTPKPGCRLDQVILNGLDITANVEGNTLTCTIPANSQIIVTFTTEQGDINNDGTINISDVVTIVNKILGN